MDVNALLAQAATAAEYQDQTEAPASFEYETPPAGYTTARFIGYVEVGKQKQRAFEGVEKPDAPMVRLTFELNGPKHITEYEKDGEKKVRTNLIRTSVTLSTHDKAGFSKLFKKMAAGRQDIKHMAQMLGEGFLIMVTHSKSKDGKKTYANIKDDGVWGVGAPCTTDPITNETTILNVPEATQPIQFFLWSAPTKEQWDSIFIDGDYEKEVDGVKQTISKNFIQNQCLEASNFVGSPLEAMLADIGGSITSELAAPPAEEKKPEPKPAPKEAPAPVADDPLAALGL